MCGHRLTPPRGESPLPLPFHLPPCPGPVKGRQALPLADGSGTSQRTELAEQLGKPSQEQQPGPGAPEAWAVTSHAGGHGTRCRAGPRPATSPARGCGMRRAPPTLRTRGQRLLRHRAWAAAGLREPLPDRSRVCTLRGLFGSGCSFYASAKFSARSVQIVCFRTLLHSERLLRAAEEIAGVGSV